jgi:hypothetical protein
MLQLVQRGNTTSEEALLLDRSILTSLELAILSISLQTHTHTQQAEHNGWKLEEGTGVYDASTTASPQYHRKETSVQIRLYIFRRNTRVEEAFNCEWRP